MRVLVALGLSFAGVGLSLLTSYTVAQNHEQAGRLHALAQDCQLRRASIEHLEVRTLGRVAGDPAAVPGRRTEGTSGDPAEAVAPRRSEGRAARRAGGLL